ncbi:nuclear transport factor 2 family protein [Rhodococcus artemisiae]|uniref:Nuclear transport factor 2 family protein n=1 Tax=Rhodococcus artemisiae TaxID=714159 RepID=A0ABU7LGM5_9NOCA|nr:nuclear transport factor 2 family protein [Rhodococcus artemisiae]MEE2060706.1 nuclear transport factor 2 family protein [Rhodococcus artemisiae]
MNTSIDATFHALLRGWADALVADDADRIGAFAEPDWMLVGPEGGAVGRETFLAFVASGDLTHSAMDFTVLDARVYGDVAVVLAHGTNRGSWRGEPFAADEWVTDVFVRRPGGWLCALSALTPNYAAAHETAPEGSSS